MVMAIIVSQIAVTFISINNYTSELLDLHCLFLIEMLPDSQLEEESFPGPHRIVYISISSLTLNNLLK